MHFIVYFYFISPIIVLANKWLQCNVGQYQNQKSDVCQKCNDSCNDCIFVYPSSNQINEQSCLQCSNGYYFNDLNGQCEKICPFGTKRNDDIKFCEPCLTQNCQQCDKDSSTCMLCQTNFTLVGNDCLIDSSLINQEVNSISNFPNYINQMGCSNLIDNSYYSQSNYIQYSFFDEGLKYMYVFTPFKVFKYDTENFSIVATGQFPYNGFIRDCGFYPPDKVNFYCAARLNFLIKYDRNLLNNTLIAQFTGYFANFGGGAGTYQGRLYQKYETGLITAFVLSGGPEVYSFETGKIQSYSIPEFTLRYYTYLKEIKGFILYDLTKDTVYFKQNAQGENLFIQKQAGNFWGIAMMNTNFLLFTKFAAYVCDSQLLLKKTPSTLATDCYFQDIPPALMKYTFPFLSLDIPSEQLLIIHQNNHGVLLIYDYSKGPQNIGLIYKAFNTTLNYQYMGNRKFVLFNYDSQLSTLILTADNKYIEKFTPSLTQYIFHQSYGFFLLQNKIIIVNSRQALSIKYQFDIKNDSQPLQNLESFLSSENNYVSIQQIHGDEPLTNFDYVIKTYYDSNLELYIYVKNYQVRLKYKRQNIKDKNEIMFQIDQNASTIVESVYVDTLQQLVLLTVSQQLVITIPDFQVKRIDMFDIQAEKYNMLQKNSKVTSCISDRDNFFQYVTVDLAQNTGVISKVYFTITDYFVGYDKVVLFNSTDFQIITLSTNKSIKVSPGITMNFTANVFYEIGTTNYLAVFSNTKPPKYLIYNMDSLSITNPDQTLTYPSLTYSSHIFDYYLNIYSIYTVQSDGIYTYELNGSNTFIQKTFQKVANIQNLVLKLQSKIEGPQSFAKMLAYQTQQGVYVIDKVTKGFSFVKTQLQISNLFLLISQIIRDEILLIQSFSQTVVYQYINGQYNILTAIQQSCTAPRYLDSYEISCYLPVKNDTSLIPVNNFNVFQIINYPNPINNILWNDKSQTISITFKNSMIKIIDYNLMKEVVLSQFQGQAGSFDCIFYDFDKQITLFLVDNIALWSYKSGQANPTQLLNYNAQIQWYYIAQDKSIIMVNTQEIIYSINYSNGILLFSDSLVERKITSPANVITYDRRGDSIYLNLAKIRVIKYNFISGMESIANFANIEVHINARRNDGALLVLTNTDYKLQDGTTLAILQQKTYTTLVDSFIFFDVQNYIFCQPSAVLFGYLIDINTLNIQTIQFRTTLYSLDFDFQNSKLSAFTIDLYLSIYDISSSQVSSISFLLPEFSDDLQPSVSIKPIFRMLYSLDCVIVSQTSSIYVYSISKKSLIYVIRKQTNFSILNFWIINRNIILYFDQSGIYFYDLHQILKLQNRFYSTRYQTREIHAYKNQDSNKLALILNVYTCQLKSFQMTNGKQIYQYQPKKKFFIPTVMNSKLSTAIYSSNSRIIINQGVILIINFDNQITDSMYIENLNVISPLTSQILNDSIIYVINIDGQIIQINLKSKISKLMQIQLQSVQFIVEFTEQFLIFQYNEVNKNNLLICLNRNNLQFNDLTNTLNSFGIQKIIKDYQKVNESTIIIITSDGYLYQFAFKDCQFSYSPTLVLNQDLFYFFYDTHLQSLFVQRKGRLQLEIFQNNQLIQTPIFLPSFSQNKMKMSDDFSFYIFFSNLLVSVYSTNDIKLLVAIQTLFSQSEIKDVIMLSRDFLLVITNTEVQSFYIVQGKYYQKFSYSIEMPQIITYKLRENYVQKTQTIMVDLSIYSMSGFITLNLPLYQVPKSTNKKCFYQLDLDSQNKTITPLISDSMKLLNFLNQKSYDTQVLDTVIFDLQQMESLQKLQTIPQQINNLVLESKENSKNSKIQIDSYFQTINQVSQNIFLRNSDLIFSESNQLASQPNLIISQKNIVYFQNITLDGLRKSYYFTLNQNYFFGIENLIIQDLQIQQSEKAEEIAFFNFQDTQAINIQTLHIKNIDLLDNLVLFDIKKATRITIQNLVIEDFTCKDFTLFTISNSIELIIRSATIKSIKCQYFQLFTSTLITSITLDTISFIDVTSFDIKTTINIEAVQNLSIKNFFINQCKGMKPFNIQKYILNDIIHTVLNVKIENLNIIKSQDIQQSQNSRFLQSTTSQIQMISIKDCQNLEINNMNFDELKLSSNQFITFESEQINILNFSILKASSISSTPTRITIGGKNIILSKFSLLQTNNTAIRLENSASINISELKINNNTFQDQSSINAVLNLINSQNVNMNDLHLEGNLINKSKIGIIYFNNIYLFSIENLICTKNIAQQSSGTCLYIFNNDVNNQSPSLIENCQFISNESVQNQGGAIFVSEQNLKIKDSVFENNKALIGGAIKIDSIQVIPDFFNNILQNKSDNNLFKNNFAKLYGQNIGYFPQKVITKLTNGKTYENGETIEITNFQSNNYLDILKFIIIDNEGNPINFPTESINKQNENIQQEFLKYQFSIDQKSTDKIFVAQSQILLIQNEYFQFNATMMMTPNSNNKLTVKSSGTIQTISSSKNGISVSQEYMTISLNINSRGCQRGDYFSKINNLTYCVPCPYGQFSLDIPDQQMKSTLNCKNCPISAISCQGSDIKIKNGYWRENNQTDDIIKCNEIISLCEAETNINNICGKGFVGPLCETCDTLGKTWGDRYAIGKSKYCEVCSPIYVQTLAILGFLVLNSVYLVYIIIQNIKCSNHKILRQYTEKIIGISLGSTIDFSRNSVLIKILMNYVQTYILLDGSGFVIPQQANYIFVVGDPTVNLVSSIDCILNVRSERQLIYLRILLKTFYLLILIVICSIAVYFQFHFDKSKSKKYSYMIPYTYMAIKVIIIYGGFGIITDAVKVLTCVKIGSKYYRQFDKRIECSADISDDALIYVFTIPIVLIIGIILPLIVFLKIKQFTSKNQTSTIVAIKSYNFLFQEYSQKAAYWEVIKIMLKNFIIFVINFFEQDQIARIQLAVLFLATYNILLIKVKPYKNRSFNNQDLFSMFACQITLINSACILSTNNQFIQYVLYSLTIFVNCFFLIGIILEFMKGIIIKLDEQSKNPIKILLRKFLIKLQPYLKMQSLNSKQQFRALKLWIKLKKKITGPQGHTFIDLLYFKQKESRLMTKQLNITDQFQQSTLIQSKAGEKNFKLEHFNSGGSLMNSYMNSIKPHTFKKQNSIFNTTENQKQITEQVPPSPILLRADTQEKDQILQFTDNPQFQLDDDKFSPLNFIANQNFRLLKFDQQNYQMNHQKKEKSINQRNIIQFDESQLTEENELDNIKIYQSQINPKGLSVLTSLKHSNDS